VIAFARQKGPILTRMCFCSNLANLPGVYCANGVLCQGCIVLWACCTRRKIYRARGFNVPDRCHVTRVMHQESLLHQECAVPGIYCAKDALKVVLCQKFCVPGAFYVRSVLCQGCTVSAVYCARGYCTKGILCHEYISPGVGVCTVPGVYHDRRVGCAMSLMYQGGVYSIVPGV
jgi:hypothetical protein